MNLLTTQIFVAFSIALMAVFAFHASSITAATNLVSQTSGADACAVQSTLAAGTSCFVTPPASTSAGTNFTIIFAPDKLVGSKIGSVILTISPLILSGGKYHNIQTTTVKDTLGNLMNGVALTMYENAGKSGGYFHGVTGPTKYPSGQTIEHDTYPGPGSYTEWSSATWNGQIVLSLKITVIVP